VLNNNRFEVTTNKKEYKKKSTKKPTRIKTIMKNKNLILLEWKGNDTFVEKEVINLLNVHKNRPMKG